MKTMSELETAVQEPEVEANPLADLVDAALAKDYNKANEIFGQAVTVKLSDVMDQERIKIAGQIFNGDADEDEDVDDEEDLQAGGTDDEAEGESGSEEETGSEESDESAEV